VKVNGVTLEEYAVEEKDDSVTSWIVSEEGQVFDVRWKVYEPEVFYAADLEVEGIRISRRTHASDQRITCQWFGKRINDSEVRPFQFSRVHLTDDEARVLQTPTNLTRSIIIRIFRIKKKKKNKGRASGRGGRPLFNEDGQGLDDNVEVFEKAKILNPHMISFSHETLQMPLSRSEESYKRIDAKDQPFFTFKFFYGPRELLIAQGIIPHETDRERLSRSPSNENGDVSAVLQDLEHRQAEAKRQQEELQKEIDRIKGPRGAGVKREAKPDISFINSGEVIDLTGD